MSKSVASDKEKIQKNFLGNKTVVSFFIIVVVLLSLISFYFYNQYQKTQSLLQSKPTASDSQAKTLLENIGKLMVLPTDEVPIIESVNNSSKLPAWPIFAKAKTGDNFIVYSKAGIAILYRSSINKIVDVSPIDLGSPTSISLTPTQAAKEVKVVISNGTSSSGLAASAQNKIENSSLKNVDVIKKIDSVGSYDNSIIIDVSGNNSSVISELATLLGGKVEQSVPAGEAKPDADILIILGKDYVK